MNDTRKDPPFQGGMVGDENWERLFDLLDRIASALESDMPLKKMTRGIGEYATFDWRSIGAQPIGYDPEGATQVLYRGNVYTRRAGKANYKPAIWFSRATGMSEDGVVWEKLIEFKELPVAESLSDRELAMLEEHKQDPQGPTPGPKPDPQVQKTIPESADPESVLPTRALYQGQPVPWGMYVKIAEGLRFPEEAYSIIAKEIVGIEDIGADFTRALPFLDLFVEAREYDYKFADVKKLIGKHNNDVEAAIMELRGP